MEPNTRRTFLAATVSLAGTIITAGCFGDDDDTEPLGDEPAPGHVDEFLSGHDALLYDGTIVDGTGQDTVTVENGAGAQGYAFNPPALLVDRGTNLVWEWTGRGGAHNVVSVDESEFEFQSDGGQLISTEGHTWSYTFDDPGTAFYLCTAHAALGQYGAVVVE